MRLIMNVIDSDFFKTGFDTTDMALGFKVSISGVDGANVSLTKSELNFLPLLGQHPLLTQKNSFRLALLVFSLSLKTGFEQNRYMF